MCMCFLVLVHKKLACTCTCLYTHVGEMRLKELKLNRTVEQLTSDVSLMEESIRKRDEALSRAEEELVQLTKVSSTCTCNSFTRGVHKTTLRLPYTLRNHGTANLFYDTNEFA